MLGRPLHNIKGEARRLRDVGQAAVTVECAGQGEGTLLAPHAKTLKHSCL